MTDVLQTLSLITLAQEYRGDVVRQINRRAVLAKLLEVVPGEGKNVAWAPASSGALAENYAEGADAANFGSDAQASAVLNWGLYRANFHVSNLAMDTAATSSSPLGNRALWGRNLVDATAALASKINQELYVGTDGTDGIIGLDEAIGDTANTYATIVRGTSAYWQPFVVDPGVATPISFELIRDDMAAIYEQCGDIPNLAMVTPAVFNEVGGLFDDTRRHVDSVMTARGPIRLDFGFQALEVDGMVFVKDKDAADNCIYYINTDTVQLEVLPHTQMDMVREMYGMVGGDDGFGPVPLGFKYEMLAKTGASEKAEVLFTGQLAVRRPNSCGVRLNVQA